MTSGIFGQAKALDSRLRGDDGGLTQCHSMLRRLIQKNPGNRLWERRLANFLKIAAEAETDLGRLEQGTHMISESTSLLSRLVQLDADNLVWRRDLAHAIMVSADISRFSGMEADSIEKLRAARKVMIDLIGSAKVQPEWRHLDALIRIRIAAHELDMVSMDAAVSDLSNMLEITPQNVAARTGLASALVSRGKMHLRLGDEEVASANAQRAIEILSPMMKGNRTVNILALWVSAHSLSGSPQSAAPQFDMLRRAGYLNPDLIDPTI